MSKPKWAWLTRDDCEYELWQSRRDFVLSPKHNGEERYYHPASGHRGSLAAFCVPMFHAMTNIRLKPGAKVKIKLPIMFQIEEGE